MIFGLMGFVCSALSVAQEPASSAVRVRAVRHQDYVRIVLTADESLARNASVIFTKNKTVRIEFKTSSTEVEKKKSGVSFATDNGVTVSDRPVEIIKSVNLVAKDGICFVTVPNAEDIKVMKLQSPSRVVIDALFTAAPKDPAPQTPPVRPSAEQISFRYFVIDAGHGGYDYGIKGNRFVEKDFVLAFARELAGILSKSGKEAVLLRKSDQVMSIEERAVLVNKRTPDILISLHASSTKVPVIYTVPANPEGTAGRTETAAGKSADQKKIEMSRGVADAIARSMEKEFSVSVSRETLPLSLLVKSRAPSILVELPNPDEFSYEKRNKERLLSAILRGLAVSREERQPAAPPKPESKPDTKVDSGKSGSKPERI